MAETNEEVPKFEIRFYQDGHLHSCYCDLWLVEPLGGIFIVTCSEIYFDDIEAIGFPESDLRQVRQLHGYREDHEKAVKVRKELLTQIADKNSPALDAAFG